MIKDGNKKLFDMIIVWKLDRFARNATTAPGIKRSSREMALRWFPLRRSFQTARRVSFWNLCWKALPNTIRLTSLKKVVRGMTDNALKCMFNGGTLPMGYVIDAEQHFQIDPVTAPYILDAFKQYDEGATMTQIRTGSTSRA